MDDRNERGSGPVTVLLVLGAVALVIAAGFTALGAVAGDEGSSAQHAADAAALAGAQGVLDDVPDSVRPGFTVAAEIPELLGGGTCLQTGRSDAADLAAANTATLTSYCYNVFRDQVKVSVRMNDDPVSGTQARADAEAASTFEANACGLDPSFSLPTETPSPTPTATKTPDPDDDPPPPPPPPPPPRNLPTWVDCGFGRLPVLYTPVDERFHFIGLEPLLEDLKPRLTA